MTQPQQEAILQEVYDKSKAIMSSKGDDYANTDRLSNFKLAGAIVGISPNQQCLSLIATKVARLGVLLQPSANKPNNESIEDNVDDLINYSILLKMLLRDR